MKPEEWKKEPALLAYRVLPQPEEFFDSWLDRVVLRHETSRAQLFAFLGLETRLAGLDLAVGPDAATRATSVTVIERFALALECDASVLQATFVPASPAFVLPPRVRHYGCPHCWMERHRAGEPLTILREWVLRQSWYCRGHDALLVDLSAIRIGDDGEIDVVRLRHLAEAAARVFDLLGFADARLQANRHAAARLLGQVTGERVPADLDGYLAEFSENGLHLVAGRTLLLAHAHCHDRRLPRRFAATFVAPTCPGASAPVLPLAGSPVTVQLLAKAMGRLDLHRLRKHYRSLEDISRRLSVFCYLARDGRVGVDWRAEAMHALGMECRRRRGREHAIDSLRLARDYAVRAQHGRRPGRNDEPFDPACWGFGMPSVRALDVAIARLELKRSCMAEVANHQILP